MLAPRDWLVPDWPAPPGIRSLFTTRSGGVSVAPFDGLNLGDHVRDDPAAVCTNRQRLADVLGVRPVFLQQVHGTAVATLGTQTPEGTVADACVSTQPGLACTVMVADCLPVLFTDNAGTVVAAAHAGWRGLAGGVLESCLTGMKQQLSAPAEIMAWLGPCIGPQAFEVGREVREAFVAWHGDADRCFVAQPEEGKYLADLPQLARLRLQAMGVTRLYGNDGTSPWCTFTQSSRFFSHRRDAVRLGSTGRMAACIWTA